MTTIAYRDGVMAADTQIGQDSMIVPGKAWKIARLPDGSLAGFCGKMVDCAAVLDWLARPETPAPKVDASLDGLLVTPDGGLWAIEGPELHRCTFDAPYSAVGSGARYALAAMMTGADARRAVEIAIALDDGSGGDVVSLELRQ